MNKLRSTLVIAAVMGVGSGAFAHNETSLTVFPDVGAWRQATRTGQNVRLASLMSASTPVSKDENATRSREQQLKAALEALGIAVD